MSKAMGKRHPVKLTPIVEGIRVEFCVICKKQIPEDRLQESVLLKEGFVCRSHNGVMAEHAAQTATRG